MTYARSAKSNYIILLQHYECNTEEISNWSIKTYKGTVRFFATQNLMFIKALCAFHRVQCTLLIFQELLATFSVTVPLEKELANDAF